MYLISLIGIMISLFFAAYEDFRTGEVKHLYIISISIILFGLVSIRYSNDPFITYNYNILIAIIVFISNYLVFVASQLLNRNGWGGADVLILSALSVPFGIYILFIICVSTFLALVYSIVKSIIRKKKLLTVYTRFIPFIFISVFFLFIFK